MLIKNKKAYFDYEILATYEAGLVLQGTEVKSIRENKGLSLKEGYVQVKKGEVWLLNVHIAPYSHQDGWKSDEKRPRKLLLNKKEIAKLADQTKEKGLTIVPLEMYFKNGRLKLKIGLARGKKNYDKRETLKTKAVNRDLARQFK